MVGHVNELESMRKLTIRIAEAVQKETKVKVNYLVGTMIELPRACITSDEIATQADFYSFGTNDLTQTVYGLSRDDAGGFLPFYQEHRILQDDPFITIDVDGVGAFMKIAVEKGTEGQKKSEDRYLRGTRRRAAIGGILPFPQFGLCELFPLPGAHRPAGRGPGGHQREDRERKKRSDWGPVINKKGLEVIHSL